MTSKIVLVSIDHNSFLFIPFVGIPPLYEREGRERNAIV
jgi:hypothetical protein